MTTAHRTLIHNAHAILPAGARAQSILIEDDRILAIDPPETARADRTINAEGLLLLPGVVDSHVHFRDPGLTHKESIATGSAAAAKGGVTTFIDMPNTLPPAITRELIHEKHRIAERSSAVNFGFYIAASNDNLHELTAAADDPLVMAIKVFIGSSTGNLLVDDQDTLERIFAETKLPIAAHCEDEPTVRRNHAERAAAAFPNGYADHTRVRDTEAAAIATSRAIDLAARHDHRFHVLHVSTAREVPLLRDAPPHVTGEACPHHLLLDESDYPRLGARAQVNPALKTAADRDALWDALREGVIASVVTDHAPHTAEEKAAPYPDSPSGLPAIENSLALMLNESARGRCTIDQVVRWMCEAPAALWGMIGKGRIEEGADADLVIVDPEARRAVRNADQATRCGWSPWDGVDLTGWPARTFVLGREVWNASDGLLPGAQGRAVRFDRERQRREPAFAGA